VEPLGSLDPEQSMVEIFGFDEDKLSDTVVARASAVSRSYSDGLYPVGAGGIVRYLHSVAALREGFAHLGYEPDNGGQVARTVHRERGVAIVVAAGNDLTGVPFSVARKHPTTKWPKGERILAAVEENNAQFALFDMPGQDETEKPELTLTTWILLQRATEEKVWSELSLPSQISGNGFVTDWRRRFLLPIVPNVGGALFELDQDEEGDGGIDISVEPK
jgi:hypothetical protein